MSRRWQEIFAAFLLGMLFPGVVLRIGLAVAEPKPVIMQVVPETSEPVPEMIADWKIPVLFTDTVVEMELESYLVGVVLAEMPASFEEEALKAQAIVARTYAMKRVTEGIRHEKGAVCTDPGCCQAYRNPEDFGGTNDDLQKVTRAVEATAGQVLTYRGELAEATYFSCSGGRTEDAVAVWGSDIPYLRSVESPGEEQAQPYRKTVSFTKAEFAEALGRSLAGEPEEWLGAVSYTQGGGVASMVVAGVSYTGVRLRQLLGLNSTAFTMVVENGKIFISTLGKGHRVGMSQYGADAMAASGSSYAEIISHYYPGTKIDKINAMG